MTTNIFYLFVVFIICLVSAYDNTLSVIHSEGLDRNEENPVGRWLIAQGGVYLLVLTKSITTLVAVILSVRIVYTKYRIALIPVLMFQLWLFFYLSTEHDVLLIDKDTAQVDHPIFLVLEFYGRCFGLL